MGVNIKQFYDYSKVNREKILSTTEMDTMYSNGNLKIAGVEINPVGEFVVLAEDSQDGFYNVFDVPGLTSFVIIEICAGVYVIDYDSQSSKHYHMEIIDTGLLVSNGVVNLATSELSIGEYTVVTNGDKLFIVDKGVCKEISRPTQRFKDVVRQYNMITMLAFKGDYYFQLLGQTHSDLVESIGI